MCSLRLSFAYLLVSNEHLKYKARIKNFALKTSGVTSGLRQVGQNIVEGGPLAIVRGPLANSKKKS